MTKTLPSVTFQPIGDIVIVERKEITADGPIERPEGSREFEMHGNVVAIGPGALTIDGGRLAMQVKVGDTVLCPRHMDSMATNPLAPIRGEYLFYCREGQLVAVIKE